MTETAMRAKIIIPEGWRRARTGFVREGDFQLRFTTMGDRACDLKWFKTRKSIGEPVNRTGFIIRKKKV